MKQDNVEEQCFMNKIGNVRVIGIASDTVQTKRTREFTFVSKCRPPYVITLSANVNIKKPTSWKFNYQLHVHLFYVGLASYDMNLQTVCVFVAYTLYCEISLYDDVLK